MNKMNYSVPEDVSLIGFDDSRQVKLSDISISSVSHPKEKAGEKAGEILLGRINDIDSVRVTEKVVFTPELKDRGTIKKIK